MSTKTRKISDYSLLSCTDSHLSTTTQLPSQHDRQRRLVGLIHLRAALLLDALDAVVLHANDLRDDGECEERLGEVYDWPVSTLFTSQERMAFALCDTLVAIDEENLVAEVIRAAVVRLGRDDTMAIVFAVSAVIEWHEGENISFN